MDFFKHFDNVNVIEKSKNSKGGIHLSNFETVKDKDYLKKNKITHVLSVIPKNLSKFDSIKSLKINQLVIDAKDLPNFNLLPDFDKAADFINDGLKNGNVLVHCAAGISRSTSCLIAFFIKYRKMKFNNALDYIKIRRSIACPNMGFKKQLLLFEENLRK